MNRIKNLLKLAGIAALGAGATSVLAASSVTIASPLQVQATVVNKSSNPVPVTGVVAVTSLPGVTLNNAQPLLVRDADNPARQPFDAFHSLFIANGMDSSNILDIPVLAGKVLVIETVDVATSGPETSFPNVYVQTCIIVSECSFHKITLTNQGLNLFGKTKFTANQSVRYYATGGTNVELSFSREAKVDGSSIATITLSGYLVDAAP